LAIKWYRFLPFCLVFTAIPAFGYSEWQQPTPEELKMTSDPAAPNAPAVYLFREETVDDKIHMHTMYARIKILSEKGKEYGDVEIPYYGGDFQVRNISGRTIHSDGTIIPFTSKPIEKLVVKSGDYRVMEKIFSMPDVQVGSIIEYRWVLAYDDHRLSSPEWYIQQPIYLHKAHYHFNPPPDYINITTKEHGHENLANQLLYTNALPPGVKVRQGFDGYDLTVENIPPIPDEEYMPPFHSFTYRLIFYYSPWRTSDEYWRNQGKYWSKEVERFASPSDKLRAAVQQIVAPGDSDQQKVEKIYAAVMKLENTSFTREHSAEENKAEGLKIKTADDIWDQKRGNDDAITRLFIALVRSAGMKAYDMIVVDRNRDIMQQAYLNWYQLDDEIAVVPIGGKEMYFDPGQRYCEFGKLHWKHTLATGIRQTDNGTAIANTPGVMYKDNSALQIAQLHLDPDGKVHGVIRITYSGAEALHWRQRVLTADEAEAKKEFEEELQTRVPPGVTVKTNHFIGLTDYTTLLMVQVDVSGSLGTSTGKRAFVPASFFEASAKPLFVHDKRENPIDLHYPYVAKDQVSIEVPEGMTIESVPKDNEIPFPQQADYVSKYVPKGNVYNYGRLLILANCFFMPNEYTALRDFYQKFNAQDQQQIVLAAAAKAPVAVSGKGQ